MKRSSHLTDNEIVAYIQRRMSLEDLKLLIDHIQECDPCRERIATGTLYPTVNLLENQLLFSPQASQCLSYEEKEAYIDNTLSIEFRKDIAAHLSSCQLCQQDVAQMKAIQASLKLPANTVQPVEVPGREKAFSRPWRIWLEGFQQFSRFGRWQTAPLAAAIIVVLSLVAWWFFRSANNKPVVNSIANNDSHQVSPGPEVVPSPTQSALAVLATINDTMGQVTINADGNISGLTGLTNDEQNLVREALIHQKIPASSAMKGAGHARLGALMGAENNGNAVSTRKLSPDGVVIETAQPDFHWPAITGATSYVVTIYDEHLNEVVSSESLSKNEWKATKSLKRGGVYGWQVSVIQNGQELIVPAVAEPRAKFKVVEPKHFAALQRGRKEFHGSHLMMSLLYSQAGMLAESETELRLLLAANPNSNEVKALLSQLKSVAKRPESSSGKK